LESRARIFGHSLHQILIVFPLGLLTTSVGFDLAGLMTRESHWLLTSYEMMVVGVAGGAIAGVAGYVDYRAIPPNTRAKKIGRWHGLSSLVVLLIFALSAWVRTPDPEAFRTAGFVLSFAGVALAGIAGWLGGELVTRMGVGVIDGAHVDA
jgi:uncharacterized membrane protein